jgi:hypothetical protein
MNKGQYVFAQIATFLPARVFDRCVNTYNGNKAVKHFTCWHQLMCMMFGQLSSRDSLRDLIVCINAHKQKHYHLGFGKNVSRSTLADANELRDYRIYETFAYELIAYARKLTIKNDELEAITSGGVYAIDTTVVDLCLNVFWWASFRQTKGAIKIHTLLDVKTAIPVFVHITPASVHDVNGLDLISYETGGFYIMDRGYVDFKRLSIIDRNDAFFVIRSRDNLQFRRVGSAKVDKSTGVICDQQIVLQSFYPRKAYSKNIRRIKYYDTEQNRMLIFLTNNNTLTALQIALLYRYRWRIELLFKWIKQHLKIKTFWGRSMNAVKTQVYIAIIAYVLVIVIKERLKLKQSIYEIIQILGVSLVDKTPMKSLFQNPENQDVKELNDIQLKINLF